MRTHTQNHVFGEISRALQLIVRNELQLMRVELKGSRDRIARDARTAIICGALAIFGLLPFMAFLVIGLGRLLGDNYWLSALIISVLCIGVGGAVALGAVKRIGNEDFTLPRTRRSMSDALQRTRSAMEGVQFPLGLIGRTMPRVPTTSVEPAEEIFPPTPPAFEPGKKDDDHRRIA